MACSPLHVVDQHRRDCGDSVAVAKHSARSVLSSNPVATCESTTVALAAGDQ